MSDAIPPREHLRDRTLMFPFFNSGIHAAFLRASFHQQPRRDQDAMMQSVYDEGYGVKDIEKVLHVKNVNRRINAHRGRGPNLAKPSFG